MSKDNIVVQMYDELVEINQESGYGFDLVLKKIEPFICSQAFSFDIPNLSKEDFKQDIYIIAIQGIKNYNPSKGTKLSTFLHTHIINKIISKLKSTYRKSKDASYISSDESFSQEILKDEFYDDDIVELGFDFFKNNKATNLDFELFLDKLKNNIEYDTWLLIKLICIDGHSVREASDKLGIKFWTAAKKIKELSKNEYVLEFYEKKN